MSTANANDVARELARGYAVHADLIADVPADGDLRRLQPHAAGRQLPDAQAQRGETSADSPKRAGWRDGAGACNPTVARSPLAGVASARCIRSSRSGPFSPQLAAAAWTSTRHGPRRSSWRRRHGAPQATRGGWARAYARQGPHELADIIELGRAARERDETQPRRGAVGWSRERRGASEPR